MAGRALRFLDGRLVDTSPRRHRQKSFPFKNRQAVVFIMLLTTLASTFCTEMPPPESFRPGSRALDLHGVIFNTTLHGSTITPTTTSSTCSCITTSSSAASSSTLAPPRRLRGSSKKTSIVNDPNEVYLGGIPFIVIGMMLTCMMPAPAAGGQQANFMHRIPPAWSPDNDRNYSFRSYMTDISLWVMLTDLAPHQQAAAIIMRLGGQAREFARCMSPQEIIAGGWRGGVLYDPVTYLLGALQLRFANLEEETRLQSMTEMLAFARRQGEDINALLTRYEVVRQRAANEGRFL